MSGILVKILMRKNGVTIRELAARLDMPMTTVRRVRRSGLASKLAARDWVQAITGADPGPL
jgi:DNA-binding IclR family transcriptional regulator